MESALETPLVVAASKTPKHQHDLVGYAFCAAMILSWVFQSEVAQAVQTRGYNKPMALTWFNHAAGVLIIPVMWLCGMQPRVAYQQLTEGMTRKQLFQRALALSSVYLFADWFWYIGLPYTSVAMGTTVFNTSSCWVYALMLLLGQPHRWRQTVALLGSLAGVVVLSSPEPGDLTVAVVQGGQLIGSGFVLLAAMGYAVYEIFFDKALDGLPSSVNVTNVFVAVCAVLNSTLLWPLVLCLALPFWPDLISETPELPSRDAFMGLCVNALLATCFNVTLALAIIRTSPLVASVSCILTIPTSLVVDSLVHGDSFGSLKLVGSLLIVASFALLAYDKTKD